MNRKNILFVFLICIIAIGLSSTIIAMGVCVPNNNTSYKNESPVTTFSEVYIPSETSEPEEKEEVVEQQESEVIILELVEVKRVEPATLEEANTALETAKIRHDEANKVYNGLINLGYPEDHPAVVLAATEVNTTKEDYQYYENIQKDLEEAHKWEVRAAEYPVATQAWLYMKNEFGWSDTVCAAVIGNFMAECGGCWSSDLDYQVNSSHGIGMAQWIGGRRTQLIQYYGSNPSVEAQLLFMKDELYGTNGVVRQVNDYQFNQIMNAATPEESAFAFATYFERCAEQYRYPRQSYARQAYEYFVG